MTIEKLDVQVYVTKTFNMHDTKSFNVGIDERVKLTESLIAKLFLYIISEQLSETENLIFSRKNKKKAFITIFYTLFAFEYLLFIYLAIYTACCLFFCSVYCCIMSTQVFLKTLLIAGFNFLLFILNTD